MTGAVHLPKAQERHRGDECKCPLNKSPFLPTQTFLARRRAKSETEGYRKQKMLEISGALVRVTVAVMKQNDQRKLGKEKVYLAYTFRSQSITGESRAETQAGPEAETVGEMKVLLSFLSASSFF